MPSWGRCDFEDLKKFQEKLEKVANADTQKFIEDTVKKIASELLAKVIPLTPTGVKPYFLTKAKQTIKVKGNNGKQRSFLSREGAILEKYWSGYVGGTLKRGWTARNLKEAEDGIERSIDDYLNSIKVNKQGNNYVIVIENPVKYASYVEYGHRQEIGRYVPQLGRKLKEGWVDGKLMLTISEKELNGQLDKIVEQKLSEFLGECLKNG